MGDKLVDARAATFNNNWPHEGRKGWKCKTKKLVEAGWCYDPSPEFDDGVRCFYCDLSLDGWEPKDDPEHEHRRRSPDCPFFLLVEEFAATRPPKSKKARGSRVSKVSRLSTLSNMTVSEAPSIMSSGEGPAGEDDSILTTVTNTITSIAVPKSRKQSKAASKTTRKASKSKKAPPADASVVELSSTLQTEEPSEQQEPPKRTTRRVASRTVSAQADVTVIESQPTKQTKPKGKKKVQPRLSEDESQLHSELQAAIEASIASSSTPKADTKTNRGTKRTSDGQPKMESSVVMILEDPPATQKEEKPKAKRGRKPKQAQPETQRSSDAADNISEQTEAPKPAQKGRKGKKAAKATAPDPEETQSTQAQDTQPEAEVAPSQLPQNAHTNTPPSAPSANASPAPSTPTPAKALARPVTAHIMQQPPAARTPSASPQSSDAENKPPPPSSRALPAPPQPARVPLAAAEGRAANASPFKARALAKPAAAAAWEPADLENVFLASPVRARLALGAEDGFASLASDGAGLREVAGRVRVAMGERERAMSVEEWVRWNALRGEEELRRRCEEMVMVFEKEGNRAMAVIEGIQCL